MEKEEFVNKNDMIERTKKFAIEIIKLINEFPKTTIGIVFGQQLLKSATSVGANYRSACRAQSYSHFISKISIAEEEADETIYWLELLKSSEIIKDGVKLENLIKEAKELTAILTSARKTAKHRSNIK